MLGSFRFDLEAVFEVADAFVGVADHEAGDAVV